MNPGISRFVLALASNLQEQFLQVVLAVVFLATYLHVCRTLYPFLLRVFLNLQKALDQSVKQMNLVKPLVNSWFIPFFVISISASIIKCFQHLNIY